MKNINLTGKRKIVAALLLVVAALITVGIVAAYYSDFIQGILDLTTNTLNIEGNYQVYLNGDLTSLENINGLNPGDLIVVKGTVNNVGNQSAWIREKIAFQAIDQGIFDHFEIYDTELTLAQITSGSDLSENLLDSFANGVAVSDNKVINGVGSDATTESSLTYNYLNSTSMQFAITIYFKLSAPNSTQGKAVNITISTEALQFKNNNAAEPDETKWAVVAAA